MLDSVYSLSSAFLDLVLTTIEEMVTPLSRLTRDQANDLVRKGSNKDSSSDLVVHRRGTVGRKRRKVLVSSAGGSGNGGGGDDDGSGSDGDVRRDMDVDDTAPDSLGGGTSRGQEDVNPATERDRTPLIHEESMAVPPENGMQSSGPVAEVSAASAGNVINVEARQGNPYDIDIPFPVLDASLCGVLASAAGAEGGGGSMRNRLQKILRYLCLYDGNWFLILESLSKQGASLASTVQKEAEDVHAMLYAVLKQHGDASVAMSLPLLSAPSSVTELRLLRVLNIMTAIRPMHLAANPSTEGDHTAEIAGSYIRAIDFGNLWDLLCECLDAVRLLEGIKDADPSSEDALDDDRAVSANTSGSKGLPKASRRASDALQPSVSSLTMRFMPLIECYMAVSGSTILRQATEFVHSQLLSAALPEDNKRKENPVSSTAEDGSVSAMAQTSEGKDGGATDLPTSNETSSPQLPVTHIKDIQKYLAVPGMRFRQHAEYRQMQMELEPGRDATRLIAFVDRNRVLLNMVLRQNMYLLEGSFLPLAVVPRLRKQLHFDIKRAYFKMRLRRMKQQGSARQIPLRVTVHRNRVFEESFQKLRYCTAEEMRRRLSVTFHGEEGIDVGGLTREWYSVLAKEIFNANYCLTLHFSRTPTVTSIVII